MTRATALAALAAVALVAGVVLLTGGSKTSFRLDFSEAGGLVEGGEVRVAGRQVGTIDKLALRDDGVVAVTVTVEDGKVAVHRDARATIRAAGLATITNNFIELDPGSDDEPRLQDEGLVPNARTQEIVNVDAVLQSFGPRQRSNLGALIQHGAELYAGSGARYLNATIGKLNPALRQLNGVAAELNSDQAALDRFLRTAAQTTKAVAARDTDLENAVVHSARAFGAIARERASLAELLERSPGVLRQARGTLDRAGSTLTAVRPALRDVPPAAKPLNALLQNLSPTLRQARPVVSQLRRDLPPVRRTLQAVPDVKGDWIAAFRSLASLKPLRPIAEALRYYAYDLLVGVPNGLAGLAVGSYNDIGHYIRLEFVQNFQTILAGAGAPLFNKPPLNAALGLKPSIFDVRTKLTRRCPGAAVPPAPDGSSPLKLPKELCDLSQTPYPSVNEP